MSKLKPLPKALIIAAIIGVVGYGVTFMLPKHKATIEPEVKNIPALVVVEQPTEQPKSLAPKAAEPKIDTPEIQPAPNAGLDSLLNSGTKK